MKKTLCIFLSAIILFLTSCNVTGPIDIPDEIESPSESSPESSSTPIEESIPSPEVSESDTTGLESTPLDPEEDIEITFAPDDVSPVHLNVTRLDESLKEFHNSAVSDSVNFNNNSFYYKYSREHGFFNVDVYQTKDELMELQYYSDTSKIASFRDYTFNTDNVPQNEEACRKLAESLILKYSDVSLSEYTYSCKTNYTQHHDNGAASKNVLYFYTPTDTNQELSSHTFIYTRYVGDYKTSDQISVRFTYFESISGISISWGYSDFKDVTDVDLEYANAHKAIDAYYRDIGFKYDRLLAYADMDNYYLSFSGKKMYLACSSAMRYYSIKWHDVKNGESPICAWLETLLVDLEPEFNKGETSKEYIYELKPLMSTTAVSSTLNTSLPETSNALPNEFIFGLAEGGHLICRFSSAADIIDEMKEAKYVDLLVSVRIIHETGEEELLFDVSKSEDLNAEDVLYYPLLRLEYLKKLKANMTKKEVIALIGDFHVSDNPLNGYYYIEHEQLLYLEYFNDSLVDARVINASDGLDNALVEVLFSVKGQDLTSN